MKTINREKSILGIFIYTKVNQLYHKLTKNKIKYFFFPAGYSEDSDYTSDLNYPVGGQGANSSASQFRTAANQLATPQRSLETSRENSYERDDHQVLNNFNLFKVIKSYLIN